MIAPIMFSSIGIDLDYPDEYTKDVAQKLAIWALDQEITSMIISVNNIVYIDRINGHMRLIWDATWGHKVGKKIRKPAYFKLLQEEFIRVCKLKAFA